MELGKVVAKWFYKSEKDTESPEQVENYSDQGSPATCSLMYHS